MSGQKINPLIEEMDNWDKDKRFMAASDLTQEVLSSGRHGRTILHSKTNVHAIV